MRKTNVIYQYRYVESRKIYRSYLQDRNRDTDVEKKQTDIEKRMEAGVG